MIIKKIINKLVVHTYRNGRKVRLSLDLVQLSE